MFKVFSRPQIDLGHHEIWQGSLCGENDLDQEILEQAEIQVKYSGYIEKKEKCG
jgi:tRNA uridine 5-carboxymethylaminomethyl modification enzyme